MLKRQNGQALLIVVLVMVVALTVGLSVASRTIINLKNTQNQADSQKALAAAEAGVEQGMRAVGANQANLQVSNLGTNLNYSATVASISAGTDAFMVNGGPQPNMIYKNQPAYIWTTNYSDSQPFANSWNGNLALFWGDNSNGCNDAALEISVISGDRANPTLTRYAEDPCNSSKLGGSGDRASTNNFDFNSINKSTETVSGKTFHFNFTIPISTGIYLVSVNPVYQDAYVAAQGTNVLPYQGNNIDSTGTVGTIDNPSVQRKEHVYEGFPQILSAFFPYTIFSP